MRQAYGGTWLIQLVLVFIILFAVYIVLTLDYSKTIKVKNEAISIIEKYDGLNEKSITTLNNYLASSGYKTLGGCGESDDFYGATDLSIGELEKTEKGKKYYYCIKKYKGTKNTYYYQISLFYNFNINFLGVSTYYTVKGTTSNFEPYDDQAYGGSPEYEQLKPTETTKPDDNYTPPVIDNTDNPGDSNIDDSKICTVRFDSNGGSTVGDRDVVCGNKVSKPATPENGNLILKAWNLNGTKYNFSNKVNSNISLIAEWTKVPDWPHLQGIGINNPKYWTSTGVNTGELKEEYSSNWNHYCEELLKDYQSSKAINFNDTEKSEAMNYCNNKVSY